MRVVVMSEGGLMCEMVGVMSEGGLMCEGGCDE